MNAGSEPAAPSNVVKNIAGRRRFPAGIIEVRELPPEPGERARVVSLVITPGLPNTDQSFRPGGRGERKNYQNQNGDPNHAPVYVGTCTTIKSNRWILP